MSGWMTKEESFIRQCIESPVGALTLTASEDALTALSFPQERYPEYVERLTKEREVCIPARTKSPDSERNKGMAGYLLFRKKAGLYPGSGAAGK